MKARTLSRKLCALSAQLILSFNTACDPPQTDAPTQEAGTDQEVVSSSWCDAAALVAVNTSDSNLYRWERAYPASGGFTAAAKVGSQWAGIRLIASDSSTGNLFAIDGNNDLSLYTFNGSAYSGPNVISHNWQNIQQLIPGDYGVLYGVGGDGNLYWYRWKNGAWATGSGTAIGSGWSGLSVFSGGNGIIYAIVKSTGSLRWYRHLSPIEGASSWVGPTTIGSGWASMRMVVGLGSGVVYAVDPQGRLLYYQHNGYGDGSANWSNGGIGVQIGSGWGSYDRLTANSDACATEAGTHTSSIWSECVPFYGPEARGHAYTGNGETVTVDAAGRPVMAHKEWGYWGALGTGSSQSGCSTTKVGTWGWLGDQGGHLIANVLGGWAGRANVVPQNGTLNTGIWRSRVEALARKCVLTGLGVNYTVVADYDSESTVRPDALEASLFVYAGANGRTAQVKVANAAPTAVEYADTQTFADALRDTCVQQAAEKCEGFSGPQFSLCVSWSGGYPDGAVRATQTGYYALKLQTCSAPGTKICVDSQYIDVPDTDTVGAPLTLGSRVGRFGMYRACGKVTASTDWVCMHADQAPYLGE